MGIERTIQFYIASLEENKRPHLEMLKLLLNKYREVGDADSHFYCHVLQQALIQMKYYKNLHFDVVEVLLPLGVQFMSSGCSVPFLILKDSYFMMSNRDISEKVLLKNIASYIALEKKYYPESKSSLTIEEFKFFTRQFKYIILRMVNPHEDSLILDFFFKKMKMYNFPKINENASDTFDKQLNDLRFAA